MGSWSSTAEHGGGGSDAHGCRGVLPLETFTEDCLIRNMTPETVRRYKSSLVQFQTFLQQNKPNIANADRDVLRLFLQHLRGSGVKQKTVENDFTAISAFYDYLVYERFVDTNPVPPFRKRYLRQYKDDMHSTRRLLSIEEMSQLVNSILDPRDSAIAVLFAKTGIRRGELLRLNVSDINWEFLSITLKPGGSKKRSNPVVFFDDECAIVLQRWLRTREALGPKTEALFVSYESLERLSRNAAWTAVVKYARRLGFHDSHSSRLEDHFGPHCFRHWFTTWLMRNGMPREYVKELRGDSRREAIDIYHHIDSEDLRKKYLACIPKLGLW